MLDKRLLKLLTGSKKYIFQTVFWNWTAMLANTAVTIAFVTILDTLRTGSPSARKTFGCTGLILCMIIIRALVQKAGVRSSYKASGDVKKVIRGKIYRKLLDLGSSYQGQVVTSQVVQTAMEGVEQLEIYFGKYIPQLFYSLVAPLTLFLITAPINIRAAAVLFVCVPLIPASIMAVQKIAKRLLKKYWGTYTTLGDGFLENLQGLTTLKIYQADERKRDEMDSQAEDFRKATMRVLVMQLNSISIMDIVAYGGAAAGIGVALYEYHKGSVGFAGILIIILLAAEFFIPMRLLGSFFHIAMNGAAASDKIFHLLELEVPEKGDKIIGKSGGIQIKNLQFSYEAGRIILQHINLDIKENSFTAIVGASGCGKSTIAGLLTGKNRGYQGQILINGTELAEAGEEGLLRTVTLVPHNGYLFAGTVEENLLMGKADASEEDMMKVLKQVRLYDFLERQKGLKTRLNEQGSNLSGGQRQRLVLARALLRDTPVYIFDEATSNIDVESEEKIVKIIHEMKGCKTVIMISHRLAIVQPADRIYYMEEGNVRECGSHHELLETKGGYCRIYRKQSELEKIREVVGHA